MDYWKRHENYWNFWRKPTGIYRTKESHRDLLTDFDCTSKTQQRACKTLRFWTKMKIVLKDFKKILRFLIKIYGYLTFSQFSTTYFFDFWRRSEGIDLWKIIPVFYNNFSDWGGGVPAFLLLRTLLPMEEKFQLRNVCRVWTFIKRRNFTTTTIFGKYISGENLIYLFTILSLLINLTSYCYNV